MRLVLVHGINNENSSSQKIIDDWLAALTRTLSADDMAAVRRADIVAPYYGDILAAATSGQGPSPIAQSAGDIASDQARFYLESLEEMAKAAGVTETDVRAAAGITGPVEQSLPHDRRLLGLLRALETISPLKGALVLRLLPQAFVYLNRVAAAKAVDDIVRPALSGEPCVVVAHSLGTIVTFKLLRENPVLKVPLYLTLGSPLAVKSVKNAIGPAFRRPVSVVQWLNALDRDDAVTLGRSLNEATFGPEIANIDDVDNGESDAHAISSYLHDARVAGALRRALP